MSVIRLPLVLSDSEMESTEMLVRAGFLKVTLGQRWGWSVEEPAAMGEGIAGGRHSR